MWVPSRTAWSFLILLAGGLVLLLAGGTAGAGCLGPIGVTGIQCSKATGVFPMVLVGTPVAASTVLLAAVVGLRGALAWPARSVVATMIGSVLAAFAYVALRPTIWTGPTSTGEVITLDLPLDFGAMATVAILGATGGLICAWAVRRVKTGRQVKLHPA